MLAESTCPEDRLLAKTQAEVLFWWVGGAWPPARPLDLVGRAPGQACWSPCSALRIAGWSKWGLRVLGVLTLEHLPHTQAVGEEGRSLRPAPGLGLWTLQTCSGRSAAVSPPPASRASSKGADSHPPTPALPPTML